MKILVAITGASGALYAQRLLDNLDPRLHEIHVVLSSYAQQVISEELPGGLRLPADVKSHNIKSMNAPFASGSNPPDAMVVIPCTMGTLGRIAHGYSEDVLLRAADVALKEKRKLILVPRETPFNLVHVKNFELLIQAGATILPANPSFYTRPQTIEQVVDTVVARVLDHLGYRTNFLPGGQKKKTDLQMLSVIGKWASFVKFSHTIFALPFALAAMAVAARENRGWPGWPKFLLILTAMVCARTCAMSFNRIVDRKFDALNPRTAGRHLPAGKVSLAGAIMLWAVSGAGLITASYFESIVFLSVSGRAGGYLFLFADKAVHTGDSHVFLGVALALAPVGAWLAVKGADVSILEVFQMLTLAAAVVLWLTGFDIIYALQDYDFDRSHGLHSLVVAWGQKNALQAAFLAHVLMCGLLFVFGFLCGFRIAYLVGWFIIVVCLVLEHWIARRRSLDWINIAFFRLNALISLVFMTVTIAEVAFPWFRFGR